MVRSLTLFVLVVLTLISTSAWAQPIDVERFKPALTQDPFVISEGTDVGWEPDHSRLQLGVAVNGAWNPLVVVDDGDITNQIVSGRAGFDLFGSLSLARSFALGVGLPLFAAQTGDADPQPSGVGDLRLVPKIRLTGGSGKGLGLALIPEVRLPTHSDDQFSGGARSPVFAPRLAADHWFGGFFRLGVNVGVLLREPTQFVNVTAASELTYSAAAELSPGGRDGLAVGVDVYGGAGLDGLDLEEAPLEGQLYVRLQPTPEVQVQLGPAMGIVAGYGTPTLRLFAGVRWSPKVREEEQPFFSTSSPCPEPAVAGPGMGLVRVTVVDAEDDHPIERARARVDEVATEPTGVPGQSAAEVAPGDHVLWVRARGYVAQRIDIDVPESEVQQTVRLVPAVVTITDEKLEFKGTVYFAFDSAALEDEETDDVLDEMAAALNAHPEIKLVRVEGHTDSTGAANYNQRLSERRAESVRGYLISAGVDAERLESAGYGESRPISEKDSENRRVEFVIVRGKAPEAKIIEPDPG